MNIEFESICDDLVQQSWSHKKNFFNNELCDELFDVLTSKKTNIAGIGINGDIDSNIRNDRILWLDKDDDSIEACVKEYLNIMDELKNKFNYNLYAGIDEYNGHFSTYEAGCKYGKHIDRLKNHPNERILTWITYLNPFYDRKNEGCLKLYVNHKEIIIPPEHGSIVCFRSDDILHEVMLTHANRHAITGWFSRKGVVL